VQRRSRYGSKGGESSPAGGSQLQHIILYKDLQVLTSRSRKRAERRSRYGSKGKNISSGRRPLTPAAASAAATPAAPSGSSSSRPDSRLNSATTVALHADSGASLQSK